MRSLQAIGLKEFNFDLYCRTAFINSRMKDTISLSLILQTLRQVSLMRLVKNKAHYQFTAVRRSAKKYI
jgi:hypothetical protein